MIYRIKYICEEVDGFVREVKIDADATFLDLNKIVLKSCGYPDDQMTSFFICDDEWERREQITREDMGTGSADEDIFVMEQTKLSEFVEDAGQHMEFVFDPFNNRSFFLDVKELIPGENLAEAEITRSKGDAPQQIEGIDDDPLNIVKPGKKKAAAQVDEFGDDMLFGNSGAFNDDELDLEGFEISEGNPYE